MLSKTVLLDPPEQPGAFTEIEDLADPKPRFGWSGLRGLLLGEKLKPVVGAVVSLVRVVSQVEVEIPFRVGGWIVRSAELLPGRQVAEEADVERRQPLLPIEHGGD